MNITVLDTGGTVSCRPDTTWERENKDFFTPDAVESLSWTPVLFAKMSKAGKCIGQKFAGRYYESVCYGILLYAEGHPSAAFFDRTSILPSATFSKDELNDAEGRFEFKKNGETIFSAENGGDASMRIEKAITDASMIVSQRIGDLVAVELGPRKPLTSRSEGSAGISGCYRGEPLFDFRIIF